jgi:hypothetical protein
MLTPRPPPRIGEYGPVPLTNAHVFVPTEYRCPGFVHSMRNRRMKVPRFPVKVADTLLIWMRCPSRFTKR